MAGWDASLLCTVGDRTCALPLEHVIETMRPAPIRPVAGAPGFVRGVSTIRGQVTPVLDLGRLLGLDASVAGRVVTLLVRGRPVGLAVDAVLGVRAIPERSAQQLPALLGPESAEVIERIGELDDGLLLVLRTARLVPAEIWDLIRSAEVTA